MPIFDESSSCQAGMARTPGLCPAWFAGAEEEQIIMGYLLHHRMIIDQVYGLIV